MKWSVIVAASLALLLVFALRWFWPSDRVQTPTMEVPDARFDYILTDFTARFSDSQGHLELLVSGPRLEHDSSTRIVSVEQPHFQIRPESDHWTGRSDSGRFERDEDEMILQGNVVLTQPHEDGDVVIESQALHHHRSAGTISANTPVEIHRPGTWLRAGGLMITLEKDLIELSNHVQAQMQTVNRGNDRHDHRRIDDADQR